MNQQSSAATLQFRQLSKCWYGEACLTSLDYADRVSFGLYDNEDGGCFAEASFKWFSLAGDFCPRLDIFSDGWRLFRDIPDLSLALSDINATNPSVEEICALLVHLGFEDNTQPKAPWGKAPAESP